MPSTTSFGETWTTSDTYTTTMNSDTDCGEWRVADYRGPLIDPALQINGRVVINGKEINDIIDDKIKKSIRGGIELMTLYDVYMTYGEDRKNVIVERRAGILALDEEDAKIKSGLLGMVDKSWDNDYLTFIVLEIGDIKVKPKPKEVKQV